ncbi:MAG TPA: ImmA/IrrE family metallo-endopeptidase [Candidatus Babeliaceae bacterium]|nr:ImmA/IrrE family metallo-endopeptidase [Candidatus Babeliaceae bacterium]
MFIQDQIEIIRRHQKNLPVKVISLANDLGVPVYYAFNWQDALSGMIIKDNESKYNSKSGYAIFVNNKHEESRQRFTIAHELAHFIRHKDAIGDGISDDAMYRSGLSNKIEAEANSFAADILMPWDLIRQEIAKTPKELAPLFKVSETAMSVRLGYVY